METTREDARGGGMTGQEAGLASWLPAWFETHLRVKFLGMGQTRAKRRMKLVEVLQLGGKRQLMLVVCDGRRYLVGAGGDSVQSIAEMGLQPAESDVPGVAGEGTDGSGAMVRLRSLDREMRCGA